MIRFSGSGNYQSVELKLFGDGSSKSLQVDLSKPPFGLNFQGIRPTDVIVVPGSPALSKTVVLTGSVLVITYTEPPPAAQITPVMTDFPENTLSFSVKFLYGPPATRSATKRARRKNT